jgi:hypothetical protein
VIGVWLAAAGWAAAPTDPWTAPPEDAGASPDASPSLSLESVVADAAVTLDYVLTVGPGGLQAGDLVRIEDPVFHGMRISKWSVFYDGPGRCGGNDSHVAPGALVSAYTSGGADVVLRRSTDLAEVLMWAYTEVEVVAGALAPGDTLTIRFGDPAGGEDCLMRAPYRAMPRVPWRGWEKRGDLEWQAYPPVTLDVLASDVLQTVLVLSPSEAAVDAPSTLRIVGLDPKGNPVRGWSSEAIVDDAYGGARVTIDAEDDGVAFVDVTWPSEGIHRVPVDVGGAVVTSNPVRVEATLPAVRTRWGDIHNHHGHTWIDDDGVAHDANHAYARDVMGLDVAAESMKTPPYVIDPYGLWAELQETCRALSVPDAYVALSGFEWIGGPFGHHNVYFDGCDAPIPDLEDFDGLAGDGGVYAWVRGIEAEHAMRGVVIPHATMYTEYEWVERDNSLRTAAEVYSEWNSSMAPADDPGSVPEGIRQGNRFGFLASSDNHDGWMGNPLSYRDADNADVLSGLAAFRVPELTREAVIGALLDRTTYATTGDRILLDLTATTAAGPIGMGGSASADAATIAWEVHGTGPIAEVSLWSVVVGGGSPASSWVVQGPTGPDSVGSVPWLAWGEGEHAVWIEVVQEDGEQAWASPLWLTPAPPSGAGGGCGCATPGSGGWSGLLGVMGLLWLRRR